MTLSRSMTVQLHPSLPDSPWVQVPGFLDLNTSRGGMLDLNKTSVDWEFDSSTFRGETKLPLGDIKAVLPFCAKGNSLISNYLFLEDQDSTSPELTQPQTKNTTQTSSQITKRDWRTKVSYFSVFSFFCFTRPVPFLNKLFLSVPFPLVTQDVFLALFLPPPSLIQFCPFTPSFLIGPSLPLHRSPPSFLSFTCLLACSSISFPSSSALAPSLFLSFALRLHVLIAIGAADETFRETSFQRAAVALSNAVLQKAELCSGQKRLCLSFRSNWVRFTLYLLSNPG